MEKPNDDAHREVLLKHGQDFERIADFYGLFNSSHKAYKKLREKFAAAHDAVPPQSARAN